MERRKYERTNIEPLEITMEVVESPQGIYENVHLLIHEVGKTGIKFSTSVEFMVNEMIHFHLPSLDLSPYISGRIAWKQEEKTEFVYGFDVADSDFQRT